MKQTKPKEKKLPQKKFHTKRYQNIQNDERKNWFLSGES